MEFIGWVFLLLPLTWLSLFSYMALVGGFTESMLKGELHEKIICISACLFTAFCWFHWIKYVYDKF
jgi:hypothetical protein